MTQMIFVNLPVTDLERSIAFYEGDRRAQGAEIRDETAAMMVFSEAMNVMLLTQRQVCASSPARRSPTRIRQARCCCACRSDSREAVDAMTASAPQRRRCKSTSDPKQEYGD